MEENMIQNPAETTTGPVEGPGSPAEAPEGAATVESPPEPSGAPKGKGKGKGKSAARNPIRQLPKKGQSAPETIPTPGSTLDYIGAQPAAPEADPELAQMNSTIAADSALEPDTEPEAGPAAEEPPADAPKKRGRPKGSGKAGAKPGREAAAPKGKGKGKGKGAANAAPKRRGRPPKDKGTAIAPVEEKPLTPAEFNRLGELEVVVERGMGAFLETGNALLEINRDRLYRASYRTYPEYLEARWKISERVARYMTGGVEVYKSLESANVSILPSNQSQTRHLIGVPEEKRAETWDMACEAAKAAGLDQPQEKHVKEAADKVLNKPPKGSQSPAEPRDVTQARKDGVIGQTVEVHTETVGTDDPDSDVETESPDEEWLSTFNPVRNALTERGKGIFDENALAYRWTAEDRVRLIQAIDRKIGIDGARKRMGGVLGPYLGRILWALRSADPSKWVLCHTCEGTGEVVIVDSPPKPCKACKESAGFLVP